MSRIRAFTLHISLNLLAGALFLAAAAGNAATNPLAEQPASSWQGAWSNDSGMRLVLTQQASGVLSGELTIQTQSGPSDLAVTLTESRQGRLDGHFTSGGDSFSLIVESGEGPDQIVLNSEGNIFALERDGPASPAAAHSGGAVGAHDKQYRHPEGRFRIDVPSGWEPILHSPDILQFRTHRNEDVVMVLESETEAHLKGQPVQQLVPTSLETVDSFLAEMGVWADSSNAQSESIEVGSLPAVISRWQGQSADRRFSILQGTLVQGDRTLLVFGTVDERNEALLEQVEAMFASARIASASDVAAIADSKFGSGRNVVFNGERMTDTKLRYLEGDATGTIPDGQYWYDRDTGMAGQFAGPTMAFLAANLDFCPALSPAASGSGTNVAINGRFLHPQDLAGLEFYFGPILPNRYWMDSSGNYGLEGGPVMGNLIQEIVAIQMMAQAQHQGQGGYGAAGQGGGYNEALYGGGSVYRHFPNLGASGTGVTVADAGGGDTIVSAGGVMWWPGK